MKSKLNIIALLLLFPLNSIAQTTVAVVRDSQGVVLAADSRGTPHQDRSQFVKVCKIRQAGNLWFAAAGHLNTGLNNVKIDVWATVANAANVPGQLREKIEAFVRMFEPEVNHLIEEMQRSEAAYYQSEVVGKAVVEVVFVGVENGRSIYFTRDFIAPPTATEPALVHIVREDSTDLLGENLIQFSCRGYCVGAREFIGKRGSVVALGVVELARFIVAYETIERPDIVGPPIDIVRLDSTGAHWIQRKSECEEKKESKPSGKKSRRS